MYIYSSNYLHLLYFYNACIFSGNSCYCILVSDFVLLFDMSKVRVTDV